MQGEPMALPVINLSRCVVHGCMICACVLCIGAAMTPVGAEPVSEERQDKREDKREEEKEEENKGSDPEGESELEQKTESEQDEERKGLLDPLPPADPDGPIKTDQPDEDRNPETKEEEETEEEEETSDVKYVLDRATVVGRKRLAVMPASTYTLELGKLRYIPRRSASEILMLAPGVLTVNTGGEGHAHETFMRGFAAKEGKDIEFTLDGIPLNEVSNPHGHGYTDLHFMPPELVSSVEITEGPFHPSQGDFAFAGSAHYRLAVDERGSLLKYGYGSHGSHRIFILIAPEKQDDETFGGFEFYRTSGYGANRAAQRALGLARYAHTHEALNLRWKLTLAGYATRYDQAGVVRQDDYESGEMGFYDTYDPNQGGESKRYLSAFHLEWGPPGSRLTGVTFLGYRNMRLRENFTGWMYDDPLAGEQRGDGVEMRYEAFTAGTLGRYTLSRRFLGHEQRFHLGYSFRYDDGRSSQLRLRSVTAIPYKREFDYDFNVLNIAGWMGTDFRPFTWAAFQAGVRIDTFSFGVTDLDGPEADREGDREPDSMKQSFGYAVNPRVTLDFTLTEGLNLAVSYGQGTRSTEAAALSDNETAPFALSRQFETGISYAYGSGADPLRLKIQAGYVFASVDKDLMFSPIDGRNILVGSSTRHAVLAGGRLGYSGWLDALLNVGWTHATLDETGELFPYIPQLILRMDVGISGSLFEWKLGGRDVTGRLGAGYTFVPGRPLPMKTRGDPFHVMNAGAEIRLWHFSVGLEMRNIANLKYRQGEFHYASNFAGPRTDHSMMAVRHFAAGEPFFIMATLTIHMESLISSPPVSVPAKTD